MVASISKSLWWLSEDGKKKASVKSKKTAAMQINATYNYTSGLPSAPPVLHPASNPTTTHGKNAREGKCRKDIWIYICAMEKQNLSVWVLLLSGISWNPVQSSSIWFWLEAALHCHFQGRGGFGSGWNGNFQHRWDKSFHNDIIIYA